MKELFFVPNYVSYNLSKSEKAVFLRTIEDSGRECKQIANEFFCICDIPFLVQLFQAIGRKCEQISNEVVRISNASNVKAWKTEHPEIIQELYKLFPLPESD